MKFPSETSAVSNCARKQHAIPCENDSDNSEGNSHEDLDYDEDSVRGSPREVGDDSYKKHANYDQSNEEKINNNRKSPSQITYDTKKLETDKSLLKEKSSSSSSLATVASEDEICESRSPNDPSARIKSVINLDHLKSSSSDLNESDSAQLKSQSISDRSHKRYESLLKYFLKDACYFQIKSINHENVALSKSMGVWSTPMQNEIKLNTAFREHRNVILIFSVQQSGCFQGFARMLSESKVSTQHIPWVLPARLSKRSLGGVFKVGWLCTKELPFHETQELYNPFNDNKPVKVARDGQQLEAKVGKKLCKLFPQDSKDKLLEGISTLKRQLNHRKKHPIEVQNGKPHCHHDRYLNPDRLPQAYLQHYSPAAYGEAPYRRHMNSNGYIDLGAPYHFNPNRLDREPYFGYNSAYGPPSHVAQRLPHNYPYAHPRDFESHNQRYSSTSSKYNYPRRLRRH